MRVEQSKRRQRQRAQRRIIEQPVEFADLRKPLQVTFRKRIKAFFTLLLIALDMFLARCLEIRLYFWLKISKIIWFSLHLETQQG